MAIEKEDKKLLLDLARNAIESEFNKEDIDEFLKKQVQKFNTKQGAFVTLHKNKELRGCIGHILPVMPLWKAILSNAKSAAFSDPRFPPLKREELPFIKLEISVLTPLEKLKCEPEKYSEKIKIGKHGLFIEGSNYNSGVLLPQVFVEWEATPLKALQMTCQKAGLNVNAWKDVSTSVYTFEAIVFRE